MEELSHSQVQEQQKINDESKLSLESQSNRSQQLESKIIQLSFKNEHLSQDLAKNYEDNRIMRAKISVLDHELEEKESQIREYIDSLLQMKNQLDGYWEVINQLNELSKMRDENSQLKQEIQKQNELIGKLNGQAANHFKIQEDEINKIKESYSKLENQHQFIMATASIKDSEAAKSREEMKLMLLEKDKLVEEIKQYDNIDIIYALC